MKDQRVGNRSECLRIGAPDRLRDKSIQEGDGGPGLRGQTLVHPDPVGGLESLILVSPLGAFIMLHAICGSMDEVALSIDKKHMYG